MSTINKHYCPVSADIKHTSSILLASYNMYTSPASPWLISDFNLLCRPLREGSLLFIYIVRFIYRDGETRREELISANLSARTGSLRGPAGSVSQLLLLTTSSFLTSDCRSHTFWVFKYFAHNQQSTMKIKIVRTTARYS